MNTQPSWSVTAPNRVIVSKCGGAWWPTHTYVKDQAPSML